MDLCSIPTEVRQHIASFLNPIDALKYSSINKHHQKDLNLSVLPPVYFSISENDDSLFEKYISCWPVYDVAILPISVPQKSRIHSVVLSCLFRGDNRDRLPYIDILVECGNKLKRPTFQKLVLAINAVDSGTPELFEKKLIFSFKPKMNQKYFLWYQKDGGLQKELDLERMLCHQIIFGDSTE